MQFDEARAAVLNYLQAAGRAKNSELLGLVGGDRELLEVVREDLIFNDLALDKDRVGLIYRGGTTTTPAAPAANGAKEAQQKPGIFLSYGRRDAAALTDRLEADLSKAGYAVWRDTGEIKAGHDWQQEISEGLRNSRVVIAILSPHSVRTTLSANSADNKDSVCLAEIAYALSVPPPRAVVPVKAQDCEPPLVIYHLDFVDMRDWATSETSYRQGVARVLDAVQAALRGEKRYRSWHHQLEPFNFSAFLFDKRRDFTGRAWLFERIDHWRCGSDRERALLITGDPGSGKSAIVADLVHRNPDGQVLAYHCCQWDYPETLQAWRFVRSLAAMTASKLDGYAGMLNSPPVQEALAEARCRADPASAFEAGFLNPLHAIEPPAGGPRYILIDALDEALAVPPGQPTIVDVLSTRLTRLPPWLRLVATTRNERSVLEKLQGLRAERLDPQVAGNMDDLAEFLRRRLCSPDLARRMADQSPERVSASLLAKSEGNFLYVQQALEGIERDLIPLTDVDRLPPGLGALYESRLVRQFPNAVSFADARSVLETVVAAREPLTEAELARTSGLDRQETLARALEQLSAYVPPQLGTDGDRRFAIYHKSFSDWLTAPDRRARIHVAVPRRGHERLAESGWRDYREGVAALSAYALAHLPQHLIAAERWDDLLFLLQDLAYLNARNAAGQVFDLARDFAAAWQAMLATHSARGFLRLVEEALRRDIHFIHLHRADYPQALIQSLWNYAWWYDCPQQAAHFAEPAAMGGPKAVRGQRAGSVLGGLRRLLAGASPPASAAEQPVSMAAGDGPLSTWLAAALAWPGLKANGTFIRALCPPPDPLGSPQRAIYHGHQMEIMALAYSPDGTRTLSGSRDGSIAAWDLTSGIRLQMTGYHYTPIAMAFSADASRLAFSDCVDRHRQVWNAQTNKWEQVEHADPSAIGNWLIAGTPEGEGLFTLRGGPAKVSALAFSRDGAALILGNAAGAMYVLDAQSGDVVRRLGHEALPSQAEAKGPAGAARAVQLLEHCVFNAPPGYVSTSRTVRFIPREMMGDYDEQTIARRFVYITSIACSPDGKRVAAGGWDTFVHVWNVAQGLEEARLQGHENWIEALAFSPDGGRLASGSDDQYVRVWDIMNQRELLHLDHTARVKALAFSPDGSRIVSGGHDSLIRLWDAASGALLQIFSGHGSAVTALAFSPDGRLLLSGSADATVRLWDLQSDFEWRPPVAHSAAVGALAFSADGEYLASAAADATVRIWHTGSGECVRTLSGHQGSVECVAFSPDGQRLVSGSTDGTARLWDPLSGQELRVWRGERAVKCLDFIAAGDRILIGEGDGQAHVWDAASGSVSFTVPPYSTTHRTALALSRDGRRFAAATNEAGQVQAWDPDTQQYRTYALRDQSLAGPIVAVCDGASGRELHRLRGHTESVTAMAFAPGADRLVAVSVDRALIWDVGRGSIIAALEGAQGGLDRVAYSEDGAHIVGGRVQDDTVWVWPANGGAPQSSYPFRQFNELLRVDDRVSLRAYASGTTTVFEAKASGARIGLFPVALQRLTRHPRRPLWAGAAGRHVYLLAPEDFMATSRRPDVRGAR